jgi:hypothetical protein
VLENAPNVFGGVVGGEAPVDLVPLHAKIGQRALEVDLLNSALKGAWRDNVCVERLWRSVTYELCA